MPNDIFNIKHKRYFFTSRQSLEECIISYFDFVKGEFETIEVPKVKGSEETVVQTTTLREPEPATVSGLAFFLGFSSRQAFDKYEATGLYRRILRRARLKIESEYEKRLHITSSAGAMFALKAMGWNEKTGTMPMSNNVFKVEVVNAETKPAASEADVKLD